MNSPYSSHTRPCVCPKVVLAGEARDQPAAHLTPRRCYSCTQPHIGWVSFYFSHWQIFSEAFLGSFIPTPYRNPPPSLLPPPHSILYHLYSHWNDSSTVPRSAPAAWWICIVMCFVTPRYSTPDGAPRFFIVSGPVVLVTWRVTLRHALYSLALHLVCSLGICVYSGGVCCACVNLRYVCVFSKGRAPEDSCQQVLSGVRLLVRGLLPVRRSCLWSKSSWLHMFLWSSILQNPNMQLVLIDLVPIRWQP